jgi:hypothetical protein
MSTFYKRTLSKIYQNCGFWSENTYTIWQPWLSVFRVSQQNKPFHSFNAIDFGVARFFLVQHTKTEKYTKMTTKYTKWP